METYSQTARVLKPLVNNLLQAVSAANTIVDADKAESRRRAEQARQARIVKIARAEYVQLFVEVCRRPKTSYQIKKALEKKLGPVNNMYWSATCRKLAGYGFLETKGKKPAEGGKAGVMTPVYKSTSVGINRCKVAIESGK